MKVLVAVLCMFCAFLTADFIWSQRSSSSLVESTRGLDGLNISFDHDLHGDSLGLDCAACHTGSRSNARAYMPSKSDCMDCHRLPLTENPGIETLDSVLAIAPEEPWSAKSILPEHVVFHHGVHSAAGVNCTDCHRPVGSKANGSEGGRRPQFDLRHVTMQSCVQCHKGETFKERNFKPAATYCAACHR